MANLRVGEYVHYSIHGVCKVVGTEIRSLGREKKEYYLLSPVSDEKIQLFLPVDAEPEKVKLRNVMSADEIYSMVTGVSQVPQWITDSKTRREVCGKTLRSGNAEELVKLVRTIHAHEVELPNGKELPMSDMELLRNAEKLLYNEFSFVLDINKDQVLPFILGECTVPRKEPLN